MNLLYCFFDDVEIFLRKNPIDLILIFRNQCLCQNCWQRTSLYYNRLLIWINTCFSTASCCLFQRIHILHIIEIYYLIHLFVLNTLWMLLLLNSCHYVILLIQFLLFLLLILYLRAIQKYFLLYFYLIIIAHLIRCFNNWYFLIYHLKWVSIYNLHFQFIYNSS